MRRTRRARLLRTDDVALKRYEMVRARLARKRKVLDICDAFGTTLPTLYKWIHRFEEGGVPALADRSHAPHRPNRTPDSVEKAIVALRREDSWRSSSKIVAILAERKVAVSPSTVQRALRRHDLPRVRPGGEKTRARRPSRSSTRRRGRTARRR